MFWSKVPWYFVRSLCFVRHHPVVVSLCDRVTLDSFVSLTACLDHSACIGPSYSLLIPSYQLVSVATESLIPQEYFPSYTGGESSATIQSQLINLVKHQQVIIVALY